MPLLPPAALLALCASWILAVALLVPRWRWRIAPAVQHHLQLLALAAFAAVMIMLALPSMSAVESPGHRAGPAVLERFALAASGKYKDLATGEPASEPVATRSAPRSRPRLGAVLTVVWLAGAVVLLARLAAAWVGLLRLIRRACPVTDGRVRRQLAAAAEALGVPTNVRLSSGRDVDTPRVWGPPFPIILLPPEAVALPARELRMLFLHELAHVRRRDALFSQLANLVCVLFWFHPLVWLVRHRLEHLQERCADAQVVARGVRPSEYAAFLLATARRALARRSVHLPITVAISSGGALRDRLRSLLEPHGPRRRTLAASAACALLFLALTIPAAAVVVSGRETAEPPPLTAEALDAVLNPLFVNKMADYYIGGAAISVVKDGAVVYTRGFGQAEVFEGRPVDPRRTIFRIGSVSKVMTGVAIMQLADQGRIDLRADVNDYLDAFRVDDRFAEPVRVHHLLTHTSGFDQLGYGRHAETREEVRPLGEFLAENLVRVRPPGDVTCYDTYGITLAGYLVERVAGSGFEAYLRRNIFEPLDMHRSGITVTPALADDVAVGYEFRGQWFPQPWEYMNTDPASTVNSTVTDMANFMIMMLSGGEFEGRRILSQRAVESMMSRQFSNDPRLPGNGYTLWEDRTYGIEAFSHGGSMTGFGCFLYLVPDHDLGIFVAYNQESGALAGESLRVIVDTFLVDEKRGPEILPPLGRSLDLARFTGRYADNAYNHSRPGRGGWRKRPFELADDGEGRLVFRGRPCVAVEERVFQRDDGLLLVFREDGQGRITHLFVEQSVYERLADADAEDPRGPPG